MRSSCLWPTRPKALKAHIEDPFPSNYTRNIMWTTTLILILASLSGTLAQLFRVSEPRWETLKVTWGLRMWEDDYFNELPRTAEEAERKGYKKIPGPCTSQNLGYRYMRPREYATILVFDENGYIAGLQTAFPVSKVKKYALDDETTPFDSIPMFMQEKIGKENVYTLTAYFVDPGTICWSGRTQDEFEAQGTGTALYFQNGTNPIKDSIAVPIYQKDLGRTRWTKGKCFATIGTHYFYDLKASMDCSNFFPAFTVYNRGKLTGFGWMVRGRYNFSDRFEHPMKDTLNSFMNPLPFCIADSTRDPGITSMHVYMNTKAWNVLC